MKLINIKLSSASFFIKIFCKFMRKNNWGRVITVASINGSEVNFEDRPWFTAAKAAQISISKNYSKMKQFTNKGVTFNCVSPGPIDIKGTGWDKEKNKNKNKINSWIKEYIPSNRLGKPEEVADLILFLSSDFASYINGCNIKCGQIDVCLCRFLTFVVSTSVVIPNQIRRRTVVLNLQEMLIPNHVSQFDLHQITTNDNVIS